MDRSSVLAFSQAAHLAGAKGNGKTPGFIERIKCLPVTLDGCYFDQEAKAQAA